MKFNTQNRREQKDYILKDMDNYKRKLKYANTKNEVYVLIKDLYSSLRRLLTLV